MRHIYSDNIVTVSADSENTNFPVTRVLDEHPKRIFKTNDDISTVKITLGVVGGVSDIMIAGTNAATASLSASNPNAVGWGDSDEWGGHVVAVDSGLVINGTFDTNTDGWDYLWATLSVDSQRLKITNDGAASGFGYQQWATVIGQKYRLCVDIIEGTSGTARLRLGYGAQLGNYKEDTIAALSGTEHREYVFTAETTATAVTLYTYSTVTGETVLLDNVELYELTDVTTPDEWASDDLSDAVTVFQRVGSNCLWLTLTTPILQPVDIVLTLSGPGGTEVYAGVIRAGLATAYSKNPMYGIGESRIDYSILAENSNGSFYYKKRDIVRTFQLSALMARAEAQVLVDRFSSLGMEPSAWKLTDETSSDWVVFGRFDSPPFVSHNAPDHSIVEWTITEVL